MSLAGVSVVAAGGLRQPSAESAKVYAGSSAAGSGSWYHLLVVDGFSRIKHLPNGQCIKGCSFRAGGYPWALEFYPNGAHPDDDAGFVSVFLVLDQEGVAQPVKAHLQLSFIINLAAQHHCRGLKEACLEFLKVQSAEDLRGIMETSEWKHIGATDLSIVNELITKLASKA